MGDREREAKGCTHPEDEPCFGGRGLTNVRHRNKPEKHEAGDVLRNGRWAKPEKHEDAYRPPPPHYQGRGGVDPWAFIEAQGLNYWAGNVIKYVTRAGRKDIATRLEDLEKARDFLNYMIERERKRDAR